MYSFESQHPEEEKNISFSFLKQNFGEITICLENIDSNKIRGEGVYYNLGPPRSGSSYFYILHLFSTDADALLNSSLVYVTIPPYNIVNTAPSSQETVASSKYH